MDVNAPLAQPDGQNLPHGAVPQPAAPVHAPPAPAVQGIAQMPAAPVPRRGRQPHGPIPHTSSNSNPGASAMLEVSSAYPYHTDQRRAPNFFVPDASMLFHVLGICDQMMNSTDRFLRSAPAWLPIVSQLYIAVLWNVMILRVYVNSGYGSLFASLLSSLMDHLQIGECMIPGPLVPFFQSLAAVNGPFDWIGDILPALPDFTAIWDSENFRPTSNFVRSVPLPATILDQLYQFSRRAPVAPATSTYSTFEWYRNVYGVGIGLQHIAHRLGPQLCGSLFTTQQQYDAAYSFWSSALAAGFTRTVTNGAPLTHYFQLLGFLAQDSTSQFNWFQHISIVMQKYSQYFNGSVTLKSVSTVGIGAVVPCGVPRNNRPTRDWVYPATAAVEPFTSNRFSPRREIPSEFAVIFSHADHELEEQAEQYAAMAHINLRWPATIAAQNLLSVVDPTATHEGDYWNMPTFRHSPEIKLKTQFAQIIASRFHQQAANKAT